MAAPSTYPIDTIAKLLDLTPRRVQQLTAEGVIPKAARGRYELVPAVKGYIKYLRDRAIGAEVGDEGGEHRRRLLKARADIAEMEAERLSGDLVAVDQVERTWTEIVGRFRARTLAVAPKAAPLVAVEHATDACHEIIETYLHEALAELAAVPVLPVESGPATPAGDPDDAGDGGASAEAEGLGVG